MVEIDLLTHQFDFVSDVSHRYLAMVAGYGSGKTLAFCAKGIYLASINIGTRGALLEPTNAMASDTLIPQLEEMLELYEIPFHYRATPYPTFTLYFEDGQSEILVRSAENYRRLFGLNLAWFGVDEADTIDPTKATNMWRALDSRLRANAEALQGFTTSTPEGFNFLYHFFVKEVNEAEQEGKPITNRRIIHASSRDNPFLPDEFIPSLLQTYPANLVQSYINGQFVNLNQGTVYENFDRHLNYTDKTIDDYDQPQHGVLIDLHVGMDFNINKMSAVVHIIDPTTKDPIAVDEIIGPKNTEAMIEALQSKYEKNRGITIYPDSSGDNQQTSAQQTDIRMLKNAGFKVSYNSKNPPIRDRVNSMNAMFKNGEQQRRYLVNVNNCPKYVEALETQAYDDKGKPDKSHDQDHPVDAAGYFIYKKFPVSHRHRSPKIVGK